MKRKLLWLLGGVVIIVVSLALIDSLPKMPYENLHNGDVLSIEVYAMNPVPPAIRVIEDRDTINEIVDLIKNIETKRRVFPIPSGGQLVRYTLFLNSGPEIEVGVYGDTVNSRLANNVVCEQLNSLGNRLLETGFGNSNDVSGPFTNDNIQDFGNAVSVEVGADILQTCYGYADSLGYTINNKDEYNSLLLGSSHISAVFSDNDSLKDMLDENDYLIIFDEIRIVVDADTGHILGRIPYV